jgi:hypothetical protein
VAPGVWRSGLGGDVPAGRRVRLWHPARVPLDEVTAWRLRITDEHVGQPFKQAFREVYRLSDDEGKAGGRSDRFAAQTVDYRRLYALFKQRQWKAPLLGPWDGGHEGEATRVLADGRWRASFHHGYLPDDDAYEARYAITDQVRFHERAEGAWRATAPAEVPPSVFSEAMRDIDLFVTTTSVAPDPDKPDRGEQGDGGEVSHQGIGRQVHLGAPLSGG